RHHGALPLRRHAAQRAEGREGGHGAADVRRAGPAPVRGRAVGAARRAARVGADADSSGADGRRRPGHLVGPRDRPTPVHRLCVRVRSDVAADPRVHGRRGRARRPAVGVVAMLTPNHFLLLSGVLFAIGTAGVFLRRNLITVLLSVEVMLNAVNLSFVALGRYQGNVDGQIITFFVMTVAAAEVAVGLAILIALFRHRESLNPDAYTSL